VSRVATRLIEGVYRGSAHTEYRLLAGGDQVREQCRQLITRPAPAAQFRKSEIRDSQKNPLKSYSDKSDFSSATICDQKHFPPCARSTIIHEFEYCAKQ
jgi:hypothetical protein